MQCTIFYTVRTRISDVLVNTVAVVMCRYHFNKFKKVEKYPVVLYAYKQNHNNSHSMIVFEVLIIRQNKTDKQLLLNTEQ